MSTKHQGSAGKVKNRQSCPILMTEQQYADMNKPGEIQTQCLRCGSCCRKNGPVLHLGDLKLIREKILLPGDLVALRKGEPALDNIAGRPVLLTRELIKVRGKNQNSWACPFHDPQSNLCLIHQHRPLQCRLLECWNTREITAAYDKNTLSRNDVFSRGSAMEEIVAVHEQKCPVEAFTDLLRQDMDSPGKKSRDINEMITYDERIRRVFQGKTQASAQDLDYYFGRPLKDLRTPLEAFIRQRFS